MFSFGPAQILILLVVVLLLFGKRLPSAMNSLGRSLVEFKKGVKGIDEEPEEESPRPEESKSAKV